LRDRLDNLSSDLAQMATQVESFPRLSGETDDSPRIMRAFNSLSLAGGILRFSPLITYTINSQLLFNKSNVSVIIPEGATITIYNALTVSAIKFQSVSNTHIYGNGIIDGGNFGTDGNTANSIVEFENCSECTANSLYLKNAKFGGILLDTSNTCKVTNCTILDTGFGVWMTNNGNHTVSNNYMKRSAVAGDAKVSQIRGIRGTDSVGNTVFGNAIINYDLGIEMWRASSRHVVSSNNLYGCTFGISLDDTTNSTIIGNTIEGDPANTFFNIGIELAKSPFNTIQGNTVIIPNAVITGTRTGIAAWGGNGGIVGSDKSTITGNNVNGGTVGIAVYAGKHYTVSNNIVDATKGNGIELKPNYDVTNVIISNNVVTNTTGKGINVFQSVDASGVILTPNDYVYITGNIVDNAGDRGIDVRFPNGSVRNNIVKNSFKSGIYINGNNNANSVNEISGNTLTGNMRDSTADTYSEGGIYLSSSNVAWTNITYIISNNSSGSIRNNNFSDRFYYGGATVKGETKKLENKTIGTTQTTVAHGLGYLPKNVNLVPKGNAAVWQSATADNTNLYFTASASVSVDIFAS
jgi:parallel beta-helix repeat protein